MIARRRRQALLLDTYRNALRHDPATPPPAMLDPSVAEVAARVVRAGERLEPRAAFLTNLRSQLRAGAREQSPVLDDRRRVPARDSGWWEESETGHGAGTPGSTITDAGPTPIPIGRSHWVREALKTAAAAIGFVVVSVVLSLVLRGGEQQPGGVPPTPTSTPVAAPSPPIPTPSPTPLLPAVGSIVAAIPVGQQPGAMAAGGGSIWVTAPVDGAVWRIDPSTDSVVATIAVGEPGELSVGAIAADDMSVWVGTDGGMTLARIDPTTNRVVASIALDSRIGDVMRIGHGAVWVQSLEENRVLRIDIASNTVGASISVETPDDIAITANAVWVVHAARDGGSELVRVDPVTNTVVATVPVAAQPATALVSANETLWVVTSRVVVQIAVEMTEFLSSTPLPDALRSEPSSPRVVVGDGQLWAFQNDVLWQLDLATLEWAAAMEAPWLISAVLVDGSLWCSTDENSVVRIELSDGDD